MVRLRKTHPALREGRGEFLGCLFFHAASTDAGSVQAMENDGSDETVDKAHDAAQNQTATVEAYKARKGGFQGEQMKLHNVEVGHGEAPKQAAYV